MMRAISQFNHPPTKQQQQYQANEQILVTQKFGELEVIICLRFFYFYFYSNQGVYR